jgi:hypothetical protein
MTTPTVPPVTCPIELDPLAAPCGTGLEGWGVITEPLAICTDGQTIHTTDWYEYQEAAVQGRVGACPAEVPAPVEPVPVVAPPAALPSTGAEHVALGGVASLLLLLGVGFVRFAHR